MKSRHLSLKTGRGVAKCIREILRIRQVACGALALTLWNGFPHASIAAATEPLSTAASPSLPSPTLRPPNPDYRLSTGDLIVVEMFEQQEIRQGQRLTAAGEIRMPMIGRVTLTGLTVRQAELRMEEMYKTGGFFINPQIIIFVQEYAERYVSIIGQVQSPGRMQLPEETNSIGILQAVTLAGGFTRIADRKSVQISRTNEEGIQEQITINVDDLLNARRPGDKREFDLLAGDVVFVRERTF